MDREKLKELIKDSGEIASAVGMQEWVVEKIADHLIKNGIGDITTEKHRADVAEEALSIAGEHICCDNCDIDCNSKNCFSGSRMYLIDYFKQQAEARLAELKEVEKC